jgi:hypothetical protein
MRTDLLLFEINGLFFVLARNMGNINGDEDISRLFLETNQDEKDSSEVILGSVVSLCWMGCCKEDECRYVAVG